MNCGQLEQLLLEDLDNIFQEDAQAHLEQCSRCRKLQADLEAMSDLNRTLARDTAAPRNFPGLLSNRMTDARSGPFWTLRAAAVLVAAGVLAPGAWSLFENYAETVPVAREWQPRQQAGTGVELSWTGSRRVNPTGPAAGKFFEVILRDGSGAPYIVRVPSETRVQRPRADASRRLVHVSH